MPAEQTGRGEDTKVKLPPAWESSLRRVLSIAGSEELPPAALEHATEMHALYFRIKAAISAEITSQQDDQKELKEANKPQEELEEWKQLQALIDLIEEGNDPFSLQKINLLTIYTTDVLLTLDARLKQTRMIWITGILYILGIGIMVACPLSAAAVAYAYGAGWGMVTMLTGVLLSKIEGIIAALCTMQAASEGACRQSFTDVDRVQSDLEGKRNQLKLSQQLTLDLKRCNDAARATMASAESKTSEEVNQQNAWADNAWEHVRQGLSAILVASEEASEKNYATIPGDYNELIAGMKELQQSVVPEDQAAWVELLKCLTPLAQDPFKISLLEVLGQKSTELSLAADTRATQDAAKKFAKIALGVSLAITVICIVVIGVAMLGYGLAATSSIVLIADAFIMASKVMFWVLGAGGTAAGVIDMNKWWQCLQRCCQCFSKHNSPRNDEEAADVSVVSPEAKDATTAASSFQVGLISAKAATSDVAATEKAPSSSSQSPLQKISLFANKICSAVKSPPPCNVSGAPRRAAAVSS